MTNEDLTKVLINNSADQYNAQIALAGLYMKLYGELPKIHLSGAQAEFATAFCINLPEPL